MTPTLLLTMQCSSASNRIYKLVMKESELRREKKQKAGRAAGKIRGFKQCLFWKSCAGRPKPEASGLRPAEAEAAAELLLTFSNLEDFTKQQRSEEG
jgi:hypothetical protein